MDEKIFRSHFSIKSCKFNESYGKKNKQFISCVENLRGGFGCVSGSRPGHSGCLVGRSVCGTGSFWVPMTV